MPAAIDCRDSIRLAALALTAALLMALPAGPLRADEPAAPGDGISYEEFTRNHPPAPVGVTAERQADGIRICWHKAPQPARSAVTYDPAVAHFRVYRMTSPIQGVYLGKTRQTCFVDRAGAWRKSPVYAVIAVQRSGERSEFSTTASP
jgi:hypothetical protein